jgi:hypothetical protein
MEGFLFVVPSVKCLKSNDQNVQVHFVETCQLQRHNKITNTKKPTEINPPLLPHFAGFDFLCRIDTVLPERPYSLSKA